MSLNRFAPLRLFLAGISKFCEDQSRGGQYQCEYGWAVSTYHAIYSAAVAPDVEQRAHYIGTSGHGLDANERSKMAHIKRDDRKTLCGHMGAPELISVEHDDSAPIAGRLGSVPKAEDASALTSG